MARERRSKRGEEAAEPEQAAVAEAGRGGRERPSKAPSGPSFAMPIALGAGVVAAILAFVAALLVGGQGGGDAYEPVDRGGVQAARLLAAIDVERWDANVGTNKEFRKRADALFQSKLAELEAKDKREAEILKSAIDDWKRGANKSGKDWKPGLDLVFPENDANDQVVAGTRRKLMADVTSSNADAFVGAGVWTNDGTQLAGAGVDVMKLAAGKPVAREVGLTKVYMVSTTDRGIVRMYMHPARTKDGKEGGRTGVAIACPPAAGGSSAGAGAAAGAAFVGAFFLAFLLAMGPVKAMRKFAEETEAIAKGNLDQRITVAGPDVVQAAAKNVQRIVALAQSGAAAAPPEPQIVTQQVMVQPVAEVTEGLAPARNFKRPEEFELEATQKTCPDLGNDYYDVINVDDDNVGILVADIPNMRGVRGAMYMAQVRALFRAVAFTEKSPAEVLKLLNRAFAMDLPRGVYVTAIYAIVSRSTGICRVAAAQHLPIVIWKREKKGSAKLQPEGIALGLDAGGVFDKTIAEKAVQLDKGDRIFLFTDGAITAKNKGGAQYGDERFYYVLNREAPKNSAACVNFIANDADLFHDGAPQLDDFTIVTLRRMK